MGAAKAKEGYLKLRSRYMPERLRLVMIDESPPASGKYIYDPSGEGTEPLFSALMLLLRYDAGDKASGLEKLQRRGILLVDATNEPVNRQSDKERDAKIEAKYFDLLSDVQNLIEEEESIPVLLIKANVCVVCWRTGSSLMACASSTMDGRYTSLRRGVRTNFSNSCKTFSPRSVC